MKFAVSFFDFHDIRFYAGMNTVFLGRLLTLGQGVQTQSPLTLTLIRKKKLPINFLTE